MEIKQRQTAAFALGFVIDAFIVDQISKYLIPETPIPIVEGVSVFSLRLAHSLNPHFAFSVSAPQWLVMAVVLVVLAAVMHRLWQEIRAGARSSYGLALVLGGAFGNIVDRFIHGGVRDFIEVGTPWTGIGSFNLADVCIVVGILLWFYLSRSASTQEA